jgi:hypothetical protein
VICGKSASGVEERDGSEPIREEVDGMEMKKVRAGKVTFVFDSTVTDVYVDAFGDGFDVDIYKHKHYQGALEVDPEGNVTITDDLGLNLRVVENGIVEVN